ncbi:MAG: 23S rRNA (adenine(2030)-N(6))-methyltransferase RlmJ [Tatlockia sp.]|jgi:23S rRNA (adenine2030-N6)-methyltransferase
MLSYQHGYHAGNYADVVKHLTLTRLLHYLLTKEKPLFYLETHSGRGLYDLKAGQSTKTHEYQQGISLLWGKKEKLDPLFSLYLQAIEQCNQDAGLRFYPGSPAIALHMLRELDRLFCCELHPREFEHLSQLHRRGKRVFFSENDGITQLNALLPPEERRGLIFIDPSFEIKNEYKTIPQAIMEAHRRFSTGVYCLWYPIVDKQYHEQLLRGMRRIEAKSALRIEFNLNARQAGMGGCGLWIINPPFVLAEEMKKILDTLRTLFHPESASFIIETLPASRK